MAPFLSYRQIETESYRYMTGKSPEERDIEMQIIESASPRKSRRIGIKRISRETK
jgi:hypothetical protein